MSTIFDPAQEWSAEPAGGSEFAAKPKGAFRLRPTGLAERSSQEAPVDEVDIFSVEDSFDVAADDMDLFIEICVMVAQMQFTKA